jgi:hypothetical protein
LAASVIDVLPKIASLPIASINSLLTPLATS